MEHVTCTNGAELVVLEEAYWDVSVSYYYRVSLRGQVLVPTFSIYSVYPGGNSNFDIVKSADNTVVGCIHSGEFVCLYDSSTGNTWPYDPLDRPSDEYVRLNATKMELIEKLGFRASK